MWYRFFALQANERSDLDIVICFFMVLLTVANLPHAFLLYLHPLKYIHTYSSILLHLWLSHTARRCSTVSQLLHLKLKLKQYKIQIRWYGIQILTARTLTLSNYRIDLGPNTYLSTLRGWRPATLWIHLNFSFHFIFLTDFLSHFIYMSNKLHIQNVQNKNAEKETIVVDPF